MNKLKDNTTSKAAVLCLNIILYGGPSKMDPLFAIVPIKVLKILFVAHHHRMLVPPES